MTLDYPPVFDTAKRQAPRQPLQAALAPEGGVAWALIGAAKHSPRRKKGGVCPTRRLVAPVPSHWTMAKTSRPRKLSAKELSLRKTL